MSFKALDNNSNIAINNISLLNWLCLVIYNGFFNHLVLIIDIELIVNVLYSSSYQLSVIDVFFILNIIGVLLLFVSNYLL